MVAALLPVDADEYVKRELAPTLEKALVELAKLRPADPITTLAELLIKFKPCVQRSAAGDVFRVADRVRNDADRALRCRRPCGRAGSWRCSSASGSVGSGRTAILTQIDNFRQGLAHPRLDRTQPGARVRVAVLLLEQMREISGPCKSILPTHAHGARCFQRLPSIGVCSHLTTAAV